MSKKFKRQDRKKYKKLGDSWRYPRGRQSKQRLQKKGEQPLPRVGFRTPRSERGRVRNHIPVLVHRPEDIAALTHEHAAIIASSVGARKTTAIEKAAKEAGIMILNKKKVKRARRIANAKKKPDTAKKGEEKAEKETKAEKKEEKEKREQKEAKAEAEKSAEKKTAKGKKKETGDEAKGGKEAKSSERGEEK